MLRSPALSDEQKKEITDYYEGYAFPRWTQPADYASIAEFHKELTGDLRGKTPAVDFLMGLTLNRMKDFIKPEYHLVVRYNAMLVIGEAQRPGGPKGPGR